MTFWLTMEQKNIRPASTTEEITFLILDTSGLLQV